jgi:hypothetical protein
LALADEPDPTPTILTLNYDYLTPQNVAVPLVGEIVHARGLTDIMRVNKTDNGALALPLLTVGDQIDGAGVSWSIQSVTDDGTYWSFVVAPSIVGTSGLALDFDFQTVTATPITVGYELDYWTNNPPTNVAIQGLYVADGDHSTLVASGNAFGVDALFQYAYVPTEWAVKSQETGSAPSAGPASAIEISASQTVPQAGNHIFILCENLVPITVTLPPVVKLTQISIIRGGVGAVTINGNGALINGLATQTLPLQYDTASLVASSTQWYLV